MTRFAAILVPFACLAVVACGNGDATPEPQAPASDVSQPGTPSQAGEVVDVSEAVTAEGAFILQPAAGRTVAAGGVTLTANGQDLRLVGASSPMAERVELHTMGRVDGMMRMEQIQGIDLPASTPVSLKSGGDHLMLFGIEGLTPETMVPLTFTVETSDGSTLSVDVEAVVNALGD